MVIKKTSMRETGRERDLERQNLMKDELTREPIAPLGDEKVCSAGFRNLTDVAPRVSTITRVRGAKQASTKPVLVM